MPRGDIDLGPRAVVPLDRLVAARMVVRMAVAHGAGVFCRVKVTSLNFIRLSSFFLVSLVPLLRLRLRLWRRLTK